MLSSSVASNPRVNMQPSTWPFKVMAVIYKKTPELLRPILDDKTELIQSDVSGKHELVAA